MNTHRYVLEPYRGMNTRYRCPNCNQRDKTFSLYIDTETGNHIHPDVGRCNRESNCGYHYAPKQYFQDNNISFISQRPNSTKSKIFKPQPKPISFIPPEVFKKSLQIERGLSNVSQSNHFVKYLINLLGIDIASKIVSRYFIGTSKHWKGATVFWQMDTEGKIRTGKIMLYDPYTVKRIKEPFSHLNWVHKALEQPKFELRQCLFGEHLLIDKTKPVAIVESEKTAVIASAYLPQFIWLSAGGSDGLNADKLSIIKNRTIILFPDLKMFNKWKLKAEGLITKLRGNNIVVSDYLELNANERDRELGLDIADYLIRYDLKMFQENPKNSSKQF